MWIKLSEILLNNSKTFTISDRAHLLNDVFSFSEAQLISYGTALNLSKYLSNEMDYVPWAVASSNLKKLNNLLMYTNVYDKFKIYSQDLVKNVYEYVKWDVDIKNENHLIK